mgnify:CR=1 FL=1
MSTDLEISIIRDLKASGATGDPNAPLKRGLTPEELASSIPHTTHEIEQKLKKMAAFSAVPVENCGNKKYRLTSASDAQSFLNEGSGNNQIFNWTSIFDE